MKLRFGSKVALSIVACGLLCEAQNYTDWTSIANNTLNAGDTVSIDYSPQNPTPPAPAPTPPNPLSSNLTINGNATATITGTAPTGACGYVACWNTAANLDGAGTLTFNINGNGINIPAFTITGGTLTANAGITVNGTGLPSTIFEAQNGANLTFNGNLTINAQANSTAIKTGTGTLTLGNNGGKTVKITGNLILGGNSTISLGRSSSISGDITSSGTSTTISLNNGSKISGAITQTKGTTFSLTTQGGNVTGKITTNATKNTFNLNGGSRFGSEIEAKGTNNFTINSATISAAVTLEGQNTVSITSGTISNNLTLKGQNTNPITISQSNISGTIATDNAANFQINRSSSIGKITHTNGKFDATINGSSSITNGITATSNNQNITIDLQGGNIRGTSTLDAGSGKNSVTANNNSTIGDITLTSTQAQKDANKIQTTGGSLGNVVLESGGAEASNALNLNNTVVQKVTQNLGGLSFLLQGNSSVTDGVHTSATSTKVDIAAIGNSKINGTSELAGADEVRVVFKEHAGAGTLNFKGTNTNNLFGRATATSNIAEVTMQGVTNQIQTENSANLTIGSLSMTGTNNNIAETSNGGVTPTNDGANLTVTNNVEVKATNGGQNKLAFGNGSIGGSLSTQGQTNLYTLNAYRIQGGVRHTNNGNFNADMYGTSQISNGIQTSGNGNATVNLKAQSKINGDSTFATQTNQVTLETSSQINGNTTFSGTAGNTLTINDNSQITGNVTFSGNTGSITANNNSKIDGQVITSRNTATYTFNTSSILDGGIDTNQGAGKTTANFGDNSKLQNGTSNFHADIDITFAGSSQANQEQFNVNAGTANITFQDQAQMNGGKITTNNGGTSNVQFNNTSKMVNGEIKTTGGTTTLTAQDNAELSDTFTQSGGTFNATFSDNSTFTGNATQSGGTSNITFKGNSSWTGDFDQTGGGSKSTIKFADTAHMKGNITTTNGTTDITFTENTKIVGNVSAQGSKNNVTFTSALLDGNLALDGWGNITGDSQGTFTKSAITGNVQGYDQVKLDLTETYVGGFIHQGPSVNNSGMTGNFKNSKIDGGFQGQNSINDLTLTTSELNKGIEQISGKLTLTSTESIITGGISGKSQSQNKVTTTKGSITGGVSQDTGTLTLTSDNTTIAGGFHGSGNSTNTIDMTNGSLDGGIFQSTGKLDFTSKGTTITGGFHGSNNSTNTVDMTNGSLDGGISQDTGTLDFTSNGTTITGGFHGSTNSNNTVTMTGGSLTGGIEQNTGTLDFTSTNTDISGGFSGTNSDNTLSMATGDFNSGNITQSGGSLKAEAVNMGKINDFSGTNNSSNTVSLVNSTVNNVTQNTGDLDFTTNANVNGNISGTNRSTNTIRVTGSDIGGKISQNTGSMKLFLNNTRVQSTSADAINATNATFSLYANTANVAGGITLQNSTTNGVSDALTLQGGFTQNQGTTNLTFTNSTFGGTTSITDGEANFVFSRSHIQNVTANNAQTYFNISSGSMRNFTGQQGVNTFSLTGSTAGTFTQDQGQLSINATNTSTLASVAGTGTKLTISLDDSEITGDVSNSTENTVITMQGSEIGGNVTQTDGSMTFNATKSELTGKYSQTNGTSMVNFMDSDIKGGVELSNLINASLSFSQASTIQGGMSLTNSQTSLVMLGTSTLAGGIQQSGGSLTGNLDNTSSISGGNGAGGTPVVGLDLKNGTTVFTLYNNSSINNGITALDNDTNILIDQSKINGNIDIDGNKFKLVAQNNSTITSAQMTVDNADLTLILDTTSKFIGDLKQTNNNQEIIIKQDSTFQGNITNTGTASTITINNATLDGSLEQNGGTLGLDISNKGIVTGNITLKNATTTLSGSGTNNEIQGSFSQTNGKLTGSMDGLTLTGTYSQTGGTSNVTFKNSEFKGDTTITTAQESSLTFDNSTLKNYSISGGTKNTLELLNQTQMNGTLTLQNGALATLTMQDSTITAQNGNPAITGIGNSFLTLDTLNSTITGAINFNTGGLKGQSENTNINGDITLTDTTSDVDFIKGSQITGSITATGQNSNNKIKFDNSSITGSVSQTGGQVDFELSNGSSIGQNLIFTDTTANFHGIGAGNKIDGKIDSIRTQLTGEVNGLTLAGTFTQEEGTSNITFKDESTFNGNVTIKNATSSNINFEDQSGIKANIAVTNGANNNLSFTNKSFITGDTTLTGTTATITASDNSTITGNLTSNNSIANVILNSSTFNGNITQTNGTLTLTGANNSSFTIPTFTINGNNGNTATTNINLNTNSNLSSAITANNANLNFSLNNTSSVGTAGNPSTINLTEGNLAITAQNGSVFNANITDTSNTATAPLKTAELDFSGNSTYNGTLTFQNIDITANFNSSTLNSDSLQVTGGSLDLSYTNSPNGGLINEVNIANSNASIKADNSAATINKMTISGNELNLLAENNARLTIRELGLENTKATYTALTNGNLNVNTTIINNASTLDIDLKGGMLQGAITQNGNGAGGFGTGNIKLETVGDFGGRLAPTDDMQIKSLTLNNDEAILQTNAIFASVFSNPMSYVDFTLDFDDTDTSSRVGKEMIQKPTPQPGQPTPPAPDGQTYVRQLHAEEINGTHGLFRVYTDLGANLSDNILASRASGDHIIQVQYRADTFSEAGGGRIVVAKVTDPTTTVSFKGTQSEVGLTRYDTEIIKENAAGGGFEWVIGQITQSGMSYSSKIIASLLQSQYRNFMVEVDSLDRRMGDLRYINRDLGVWMRAYVGEGKKAANDFSIAATDDYYSVWAGVDFNSIGLTVHNFAGMFFNYTGINSESKDFTGSGYNIGVGFYDTFKAFSGFYADFLIKYIYSSTSFDISNYALAKNKPEISNHKFLLNAEIGYTFYYGEKFKSGYIEPQFQVTSGYIDQTSLEVVDVSGETIYGTMARNFPITMRAGVFWGQVFGEKIKSHIKLGSSFAYDVNSGGDLHFKDSSTQLDFKQEGDFRMLLSAQTDFTFSDFFKLYAGIDTSFFGNYNIVYSANFGVRMTFGRPNNRVANVPVVYSPYEPPVVINDDKRTVPVVKRFTTKDIDQNYAGKPRKVESQIRGNPVPQSQYGTPAYTPSRKSIRDITSEVEF